MTLWDVSRRRLVVSDVSGQGTCPILKGQQTLVRFMNFNLVQILSYSCHVDRHVDVAANTRLFLKFLFVNALKKLPFFFKSSPDWVRR